MALNTEVKARELAVNTSKLRSDCDTVAIELDRVLNLAKEMYNGVIISTVCGKVRQIRNL